MPSFLPVLPLGLGPKWTETTDYSSKGTDCNKTLLLSNYLTLQNSVLQGRSYVCTMPGIKTPLCNTADMCVSVSVQG